MKTRKSLDPFMHLYGLPQAVWPLRDAPDDDDDGGGAGAQPTRPPAPKPEDYQLPTVRELIARHGSAEKALEHQLEAGRGAASRAGKREERLNGRIKELEGQLQTAQADLKRVTAEKDEATKKYTDLEQGMRESSIASLIAATKSADPELLRLKLERDGYEFVVDKDDKGADRLTLKKGDTTKPLGEVVNAEFFKQHPALAPASDKPLGGTTTTGGKNLGDQMFEAHYPEVAQTPPAGGGSGT